MVHHVADCINFTNFKPNFRVNSILHAFFKNNVYPGLPQISYHWVIYKVAYIVTHKDALHADGRLFR